MAIRMCMLGGAPRCPCREAELFKARFRTLFSIAAATASPSSCSRASICASGAPCMSNGIVVADLGAVDEVSSSVSGIVLLLLRTSSCFLSSSSSALKNAVVDFVSPCNSCNFLQRRQQTCMHRNQTHRALRIIALLPCSGYPVFAKIIRQKCNAPSSMWSFSAAVSVTVSGPGSSTPFARRGSSCNGRSVSHICCQLRSAHWFKAGLDDKNKTELRTKLPRVGNYKNVSHVRNVVDGLQEEFSSCLRMVAGTR